VIARAEGRATDNSPLSLLLEAVKRLDRERLTQLLDEHRHRLDPIRLGREIILPLGVVVGDLWALGKLSVAAEHLASEVIVQRLKAELAAGPPGPLLQAACLPGEHHEWGFLVTLLELKAGGWWVEYLGPDLPLNDLVDAAWTTGPHVVAISAVDPANVAARLPELSRLPRLLPAGTVVVMGGQGVDGPGSKLRRRGIRLGVEAIPAAPNPPVRNIAGRGA
jgi:methanogenic corrinoid protein MtbC1